jgi:hypothetical protein
MLASGSGVCRLAAIPAKRRGRSKEPTQQGRGGCKPDRWRDIGQSVRVNLSDEFGQLIRALSKMERQLSDSLRGIKSSADSVMVAAQDIANGDTDLSVRTEEQAASLEETAARMTQLTETDREAKLGQRPASQCSCHSCTRRCQRRQGGSARHGGHDRTDPWKFGQDFGNHWRDRGHRVPD